MRALVDQQDLIRLQVLIPTGIDPSVSRGFAEQAEMLGQDAPFSRLPATQAAQVDLQDPDGNPFFVVDYHPIDSPDFLIQ